jgi:hypothetical protein
MWHRDLPSTDHYTAQFFPYRTQPLNTATDCGPLWVWLSIRDVLRGQVQGCQTRCCFNIVIGAGVAQWVGYGLDDSGSISGRGRGRGRGREGIVLCSSPRSDQFSGPPSHTFNEYRGYSPGYSGRDVKLIIRLLLMPRLRMPGAITPLLRYVFMAWCLNRQWIRLYGVVLS